MGNHDDRASIETGLYKELANDRANISNFIKNFKYVYYALNFHKAKWVYGLVQTEEFTNGEFEKLNLPMDNCWGVHLAIDFGTDNNHPGPKANLASAQSCFRLMEKLGWT